MSFAQNVKPIPGPHSIELLAVLMFCVLVATIVFFIVLRRYFTGRSSDGADGGKDRLRNENPAAFVTASMQAVIQKLREQEKELERLHRLEKERAIETERLSEAVTRNMPSGLVLVGATGSITTVNPAAEGILGQRGLQYRGYQEALGAQSQLATMITACLRVGTTFQRGEIEHRIPSGESRRLGVTISPIFRGAREGYRAGREFGLPSETVAGALCLMTDLTELTALQEQIRWKENLAALGEMAAGIAHEFKNALATISGYAQMIRSEAPPGDLAENAEKIVDQTRTLTHVVTEFLRFARPLEVENETVGIEGMIERVIEEVLEAMPLVAIRAEGNFREVVGDEGLLRQALLNLGAQCRGSRCGQRCGGLRHDFRPNRGKRRKIVAADRRIRQWPWHIRGRLAKNLPSVLHHEGRRDRLGTRLGPENHVAARRQCRGQEPQRGRSRVPAMVTFAPAACQLGNCVGNHRHLK